MSLAKIVELIPPPESPLLPGTKKDWGAIERRLKAKYPRGYYEFIHCYGSGSFFQGSVSVLNPFEPNHCELLESEGANLNNFRREFPKYYPYSAFPVQDGLLLFAIDDNGNKFYWLTGGSPDQWPIVCSSEGSYWEKPIQHELAEFMLLMVANKLKIKYSRFWGNPFSKDDYNFRPKLPPKPKKSRKK